MAQRSTMDNLTVLLVRMYLYSVDFYHVCVSMCETLSCGKSAELDGSRVKMQTMAPF